MQTPVLILSARRSVDDRVKGLQAGGDDYLTKPFAFAELLARVQALIRRASGTAEPTRLVAGELTMDLLFTARRASGPRHRSAPARVRDARIPDAPSRPGAVEDMILSHVWGYSFDPGTNVVDVLVSRLRDKLDRGFNRKLIHTVRGAGYVLKVD